MSWLDFSQPVSLDLLLTLPTASDSFPLSLSLTDGSFDHEDHVADAYAHLGARARWGC